MNETWRRPASLMSSRSSLSTKVLLGALSDALAGAASAVNWGSSTHPAHESRQNHLCEWNSCSSRRVTMQKQGRWLDRRSDCVSEMLGSTSSSIAAAPCLRTASPTSSCGNAPPNVWYTVPDLGGRFSRSSASLTLIGSIQLRRRLRSFSYQQLISVSALRVASQSLPSLMADEQKDVEAINTIKLVAPSSRAGMLEGCRL